MLAESDKSREAPWTTNVQATPAVGAFLQDGRVLLWQEGPRTVLALALVVSQPRRQAGCLTRR